MERLKKEVKCLLSLGLVAILLLNACGVKRVNTIGDSRLCLGSWTINSLDRMLRSAAHIEDPGRRLLYITQKFIGSNFYFESLLPMPEPGTMNVRLDAFDCITFCHYMLALSRSTDCASFVDCLARLRYKDPEKMGLDSDPLEGNILDFTYNVYLVNAAARGFVKNITGEIAASASVETGRFTTHLGPVARQQEMGGGLVVPKYGNREVSVDFIRCGDIQRVAHLIRSGDMVLFVMPEKSDRPKTVFPHGAIIVKGGDLPRDLRNMNGIQPDDGELYFIHATRSRDSYGKPIGVNVAGQETYLDSLIYDSTKPRPLAHYCNGVGWRGIVVLRLL